MILKTPNCRLSIINLFADFIVSTIPDEDTIIQIADCENFFVVKGKTSHNNPLDLSKISDEFKEKFSKILNKELKFNTIDLIEYDKKLTVPENLLFNFYNTDNCSYSNKQITCFQENNDCSIREDLLTLTDQSSFIFLSEFPYGYSLSQGRLLYYYMKHIVYNIPSSYPVTSVTFEVPTDRKKVETDFKVTNDLLGDYDERLRSGILDIFNFDMSIIKNDIKKVDWYFEISNPLEEYSFLKKKVKDFILF